jgi:hypothetical protein
VNNAKHSNIRIPRLVRAMGDIHRYRFLCLLPAVLLLWAIPLAALAGTAPEKTREITSKVTVFVAPETRTIIYRKVALLPVLSDDPQLAADMTQLLYQALDKTGKYALLPPDVVRNRLAAMKKKVGRESAEQIVAIGRAIRARGVIEARIIPDARSGSSAPDCFFKLNIRMIDCRTGGTAWSVTERCPGKTNPQVLTREKIRRLAETALQRLTAKMVAQGDIFSPRLPPPTIIASRGELRANRLILQPDPPYVYSSYLLLGSDSEDGVFTPRGKPVANDQAPVTLEDTGLKDGTTYYYTVIGITENGLANIPAPPRAITTSGAPAPIAGLQASGNSLRHVRLFWEPSQDPDVTGYTIYRSTGIKGPFKKIAEINDRNQQSYIDYGSSRNSSYGSLDDDSLYFYILKTRNKVGVESKPTPVVSARTKGAPPPPVELRAIGNQPGKIPLFWAPAEDPDIRGYAIFRSEHPDGPFEQIEFVRGRESQQYTDAGSWTSPLRNNTTYYYRIKSVNVLDIPSRESATVSATTKPAPAPVKGVRVTNGLFREVNLQWKPNPEVDNTAY